MSGDRSLAGAEVVYHRSVVPPRETRLAARKTRMRRSVPHMTMIDLTGAPRARVCFDCSLKFDLKEAKLGLHDNTRLNYEYLTHFKRPYTPEAR